MSLITKNRNRAEYSFANINLLGICNAKCYFCLGKDIETELEGLNQTTVHFSKWKNFQSFIDQCKELNIKKIYMTGQTSDGLQYYFLDELVDYLQDLGFLVGVRSNGKLAKRKMKTIGKMKEEIGYSIHSLNDEVNKKIGAPVGIDWDTIIPASGDNVRISIVPTRYSIDEFFDLVKYISKFENVRYIQVRRISTDTRYDMLEEDIALYEKLYADVITQYKQQGEFYLSQEFRMFGKKVFFWRTVETSVNSLNYFTDGTCSDEYFIIEGYLKHKNKVIIPIIQNNA